MQFPSSRLRPFLEPNWGCKWLFPVVLGALLCNHCSPLPRSPSDAQLPKLVGTRIEAEGEAEQNAAEKAEVSQIVAALDSTLLTYVEPGSFGPYRATASGKTIALWASPNQNGEQYWSATSLDAKSADIREALALAKAPAQVERVSLGPVEDGFLALFTHPTSTGTHLTAMSLGLDGSLLAPVAPLVNSRTDILWIEALSLEGHRTALWATKKKRTATIFLASLTSTGATLGAPVALVKNARAWQTLPWGDGLALAAVVDQKSSTKDSLEVFFFDNSGSLLSNSKIVQSGDLGTDLDAAVIGGQLVLAWTETPAGRRESTVRLATLGKNGKTLVPPRNALSQFGAQRVIELVAPISERSDGFLVWENVGQAPLSERRLLLATLAADSSLGEERGSLSYSGLESLPQFAASKGGLAALTQALPCPRLGESCAETQSVPTYVEFDRQLRVIASEPIRLQPEQGAVAALGWDLECKLDFCSALAALATAPVPIHKVELRARSSHYRLAGKRLPDPVAPKVESMKVVSQRKPLTSISSATVDGQALVATLSHFDPNIPYKRRRTPAPDGRMGPVRAILKVQRFATDGSSIGSPIVLSYRARSVSGVSILAAPARKAVVMWSALDNKQPEVFATLVDRKGNRLQQRMLTRASGEVRAVQIASRTQGFLAAWIDERDGSPQIYSAPLTASLGRAAKQRQLSSGSAPVSALSLLRHQNQLWLAHIEGPDLGPQTLFLTRLDPKTGEPGSEAQKLTTSSRGGLGSPQLVSGGPALKLVWIDTTSGELFSTQLDPASKTREIRTVGTWSQPIGGFDAECNTTGCQAVVDLRTADGTQLAGVQWSDDMPTSRVTWLRRTAPILWHSGLSLHNRQLFYSDKRGKTGLIRHLSVQWR